ncbi:hypothetical protein GGI35DRAFT_451102 [Trichoderma velutinum]
MVRKYSAVLLTYCLSTNETAICSIFELSKIKPNSTPLNTHTDSGAPMPSQSPLCCSYSASAARQRGSASRPARRLYVWSSFGQPNQSQLSRLMPVLDTG